MSRTRHHRTAAELRQVITALLDGYDASIVKRTLDPTSPQYWLALDGWMAIIREADRLTEIEAARERASRKPGWKELETVMIERGVPECPHCGFRVDHGDWTCPMAPVGPSTAEEIRRETIALLSDYQSTLAFEELNATNPTHATACEERRQRVRRLLAKLTPKG
jgi:uncharacterized membrane-anchored protein